MTRSFAPSGVKSPCPICGRTKDGDCRITSDSRVFCHTKRDGKLGKASIDNPAYVYLGESTEGQGCGMWKLDALPVKAPREYGIRYFDYYFWDGSPCPVQRFRKDIEGQPKEVKWAGSLQGRPQKDVAPYLWEKSAGAKQLFVVRGELKAELLCGKGFTAISLLNQKDEVLVAKLQACRANGVEIVLVPDCDAADLDKWFRYLCSEVPGVKQLLAPGLPWGNPPADGGLGIEDWIYQSSPSNEQILAAISSIEAIDQDFKDLNTLKSKILSIIAETPNEQDRLSISKKKASELGFSLSANEIKGYIEELSYVQPIPYDHTNPQPYKEEPKLWGNLLLHQATNLLVAAPKVGKSALALHVFGCMLRGESHCLGQPIHNRCSVLIICGGDMGISQWHKLLIREGLATVINGMVHIVPEVILFPKGTNIQLTSQGIRTIDGLCLEHRNAMLLIDTFRSQTERLGYEENSRDAVRPFERLFEALAASKSDVTTVVIHHTKKEGNSSAVKASSGHQATPGAFDQTLNMNWLALDPTGIQLDKRILINSSGRGGEDQQIVVELVGKAPSPVRWISHGNAAELIKAEAMFRAREALSPSRTKVLDQCLTIYANTGQGLQNRAVMELLQCSRQVAGHHLEMLLKSNLLIRTGQKGHQGYTYYPYDAERIEEGSASSLPSADLGGRSDPTGATDSPSNLPDLGFLPPNPDLSTSESLGITECKGGAVGCKEGAGPPDPLVSLNARGVQGVLSISSSSSCFIPEVEPPKDHSFLAGSTSNAPVICVETANDAEMLKPQLEQAVQVFRQGEWESGWTICDSRNPHSLRVRTERNGKAFQLANQRWEIDTRPEVSTSPRKAGAGAVGSIPSPDDPGGASRALEMPPTATEEEFF